MSQWNPPYLLPEVPRGQERCFIVAVRRADGNVYRFPAVYLNDKLLLIDDHEPPFETEEEDGGKRFTGWYTEKEHPDYDSAFYPLDLSDGKDVLVGWQPLPVWVEPAVAVA